jgi:putative ABC transport system permease protein
MRLEHWLYTVPLRLKSILRRGRVESEMDEELRFHLEHRIEEGIAGGLTPEDARYRALRAMGGLEQKKEEIRDARGIHWLTDFVDDVRYAFRSLRRAPGLTFVIIATIALGIGMSTTPYSMLDALVFRPYPVPRPGEIVTLVGTTRDTGFDDFSWREYLDIRDQTKSYAGVVANAPLASVGFSAAPGETPRIKGGMLVSGNYFRVLGVEPKLGRGFREEEDQVPGRDAVTVLGPDFWKREMGGDPAAVGKTIRLNGTDFTVVGVAPESFPGMLIFSRPDFYIPLAMAPLFSSDAKKDFFTDRDDRRLSVKARLKPGASLAQAREELALLARDFATRHPDLSRDRGAAVRTRFQMRTQGNDPNWKFSVVFTVLGAAVLLVACTNAAGLLLSRARTRRREIAVRLAIGAGRFRLVRLLLTESLVLAWLGGLLGVAVGYAGIKALQTFRIPAELPVIVPFRMDGRVLAAAIAMSVISAIFCGLAPALQSTRGDLVSGLKSGESGDGGENGRRRLWGRNALVVAQIAMSLMLLAVTFLMMRGFRQGLLDGTGFPTDNRLLVRFDPRLMQYDAERTQRFYEQLVERIRHTSGVESATLLQSPPLGLDDFEAAAFVPEGFEMPQDRPQFTAASDTVDEGFFETMAIPILRGRGFLATDTADAPRVAIVNEQLAKHYWPNAEVLGRRIRLGGPAGPAVEIVGVAPTIKYRQAGEPPVDFLYLPMRQHPRPRMLLLLKSSFDPQDLLRSVKEDVRALDANMPILEARTYADLYRYHTVEGPRVAINLVGTMGAVGLLLALAGLYGLMAYNVTRRTREIGIRIAIGAQSSDVLRLVMGKGLALVAGGSLIGLALGLAIEQLMNSMLFDAGGVDLLVYAAVVPAMLVITMLAAWIPARRACRIPPTLALRAE